MDKFQPHNHQSQTCCHPWSLTSNQPPYALHSLPTKAPYSLPHPFHISYVSCLFWTIIIIPLVHRLALNPLSHTSQVPLSSSQLPTLHHFILYIPAMKVCLKCRSDHVLMLQVILPSQTVCGSWVFFCYNIGSPPVWSEWWITTQPLEQPSTFWPC